MALSDQPAERHRQVAGAFTVRLGAVRDWDAPTPVAGWVVRDVVRHLIDWFPGFLRAGTGIELPAGPSADDNPAASWRAHANAVQGLLDDPATAERRLVHPQVGDHPLAEAIDQFYTTDVFLHTWDVARAAGQDDRLDLATCADLLTGMRTAESALRASGHYGAAVEVPADADAQAQLLGFIGRDPYWLPAS